MIRGVIFDMDGVLLDSESFICEAATRMFAEHGVAVQPEDFLPFVGSGKDRYLGGVAEQHGFAMDLERDKARAYTLYDDLVRGNIEPLAGAREFIASARGKGLRLAVASSADRVKVDINLREIGFSEDAFDAVVSGLDVERKKPHPDIFLLAARRMGLPPETCLVVEDAVNGVQAGLSAGCRVLGLTTSFPAEDLAGAHWTAPDLAHAPAACLEW